MWKPRRFWTDVGVISVNGGYAISLDSQLLRTSSKTSVVLPTRQLAEHVAEEWRRQEDVIRPDTMPATRLANTAIERLSPMRSAILTELAGYAETDLVCFRADGPLELRKRQALAWDPLIEWADRCFGARLITCDGIIPVGQPRRAIESFRKKLERQNDFELAALHGLITLSASLVIGLAVIEDFRSATEAWDLSRVDEDWQSQHWGADDDATRTSLSKREAFLQAAVFHCLCRQG